MMDDETKKQLDRLKERFKHEMSCPSRGMTMKHEYFIGDNAARLLLGLPGLGEQDKAAIWRLEDFKGSADDLKLAVQLFDDAGEHANAESLRTLLREDS